MKKLKLLTLLLILIVFITGCKKAKQALDGPTFVTRATNLEITPTNVNNIYGYAKSSYQATTDDYNIIFIETNKESDAHSTFLDEAKNIYILTGSEVEGESSITTKKQENNRVVLAGKNWESLETEYEGTYYYLIYVDKTVLYIKSKSSSKQLMKKLIDAMKY